MNAAEKLDKTIEEVRAKRNRPKTRKAGSQQRKNEVKKEFVLPENLDHRPLRDNPSLKSLKAKLENEVKKEKN